MKIVIDLDEDTYKDIKKGKVYSSVRDVPQESVLAIANGTPLPEEHGDLIDRTKLYDQTSAWEAQALEQVNRYNPEDSRDEWRWWSAVLKERSAFKHDVADAPTIIEADRGE
jgi:hypothetical protein